MFIIKEFWDDMTCDIKFDTYDKAFDYYCNKQHFGTLPDVDLVIIDNSTGEVLLQASDICMI